MSEPIESLRRFLRELRRRSVYKVAVAYLVAGFVVVQLADLATGAFGLPGWFEPMVWVVCGLGFPLGVILAWAFEVTPEGMRRTPHAEDRSARAAGEARSRPHNRSETRAAPKRFDSRHEAADSPRPAAKEPRPPRTARWAVAAAFVALLITFGLGWAYLRPAPSPQVSRFAVELPDTLRYEGQGVNIDLAPDGSSVVFVGRSAGGARQLWERPLDHLGVSPLPGTSDATQVRFAPDGTALAFTDDSALRTISLGGAPPQTLLSNVDLTGGLDWGADGWIYFRRSAGGLWRVPEDGGEPEKLTTEAEGEDHYMPETLPSGRAILFTIERPGYATEIAVLDLPTRETRSLLSGALPRFVGSGHLVYQSAEGRSLVAVPFDVDRIEVTASPRVISSGIFSDVPAQFTASESGHLIYVPEGGEVDTGPIPSGPLVWVDRSGGEEPVDPRAEPRAYHYLELSPDGRRLAVSIADEDSDDIWVKSLPDGPLTRLTAEDGRNVHPWDWTDQGDTVVYTSNAANPSEVRATRADGGDVGGYEVLVEAEGPITEVAVARRSEGLVFVVDTDVGDDILYLDRKTGAVDELLASDFDEDQIALSPDEEWLAYVSNLSGRNEVYVRPFPNVRNGRWQVSRNGGVEPVWAHNGREIFYRQPGTGLGSGSSEHMMSARYATSPDFEIQERERLFDASPYTDLTGPGSYDVASDDERFVTVRMSDQPGEDEPTRIVFVRNFSEELRQVGSE